MKIKIGWERLVFFLTLYYTLIYILFATFDQTDSLTNKFTIIYLIIIFIYYNTKTKSKLIFVISNFVLLFSIFYTVFNFGFFQLTHSDYYSFLLYIYIMMTYTDTSMCTSFHKYLLERKKSFLISTLLFFAVILYTILFKKGMQIGYGSLVPVLYGPYTVPHKLGYSLIGIYAVVAIYAKSNNSRLFLFIKIICVVCNIWTAARSAVLGMAVIVFVDFISIKKRSWKVVIVGVAAVVFVFLITSIDILVNIPLFSKTITAINAGSITNGRNRFVDILMDNYKFNTSYLEKLFGIGMNNVRNVMRMNPTIGLAIHAHNDYINALCGYGLSGFILFIIVQLRTFSLFSKKAYWFLFFAIMFVLSYYNGLVMYTVFTPVLVSVVVFFQLCNINDTNRLPEKVEDYVS